MSDLVVQNTELAPATLFGTDNPAEVVERAATVAKTLADLVRLRLQTRSLPLSKARVSTTRFSSASM
jgi:hypothetical protein